MKFKIKPAHNQKANQQAAETQKAKELIDKQKAAMKSIGTLPTGSTAAEGHTDRGGKDTQGAAAERKEFIVNMMGEFNKKVDSMKNKNGIDSALDPKDQGKGGRGSKNQSVDGQRTPFMWGNQF